MLPRSIPFFNVAIGDDKCTHYFDRYIYIFLLRDREKYFYLYVLLNCIRNSYSDFIIIFIYCSIPNDVL